MNEQRSYKQVVIKSNFIMINTNKRNVEAYLYNLNYIADAALETLTVFFQNLLLIQNVEGLKADSENPIYKFSF